MVTIQNGVCIVDGLIKHSGWNADMAQLPAGCRPNKRLIFNLNNHASICRVDVQTSGLVTWISGGKDHDWISLSGMNFVVAAASSGEKQVSFASGWANYGGDYGSATYKVIAADGKKMCFLQGLIKSGSYGNLLTLPAECRPSKRLIFEVNNHAKQCRVDVQTNGIVSWHAGGRDHAWISITGIAFTVGTAGQSNLPLTNSWRSYGGSYGTATYTKIGAICFVEGLIKSGNFGQGMAALPSGCRPNKRLIMNTNNHEDSARSDIYTNGNIQYAAGSKDHGWMSLTGMTFSIASASSVSKSVDNSNAVISGSINVEKHLAGRNGVGNKHLRYISGGTDATFNSGPCLTSQYTVCSATRYTGGTKGRILNGGSGNWLHGHWASRAGIAHYNAWQGQHNGRVSPNTNWVYMCAYNSAGSKSMHINGRTYTNIAGGSTSVPSYIGINVGGCCGGEKSQWALAFLATFNGHLTNTEMNIISKYMMQR